MDDIIYALLAMELTIGKESFLGGNFEKGNRVTTLRYSSLHEFSLLRLILEIMDGHNNWDFLQAFHEFECPQLNFAILILNQPILCHPKLIKLFWNNAALRGLVDGGSNRWFDFLQKTEAFDLKTPDFLSGDFDSLKPEVRAYFEGQQVNIISTPDQDETDFTKALRCVADISTAKRLNIKMVFVVCENSGRFDQIISNINTLYLSNQILPNIPVILVSSQNITCLLRSGKHTIKVSEEFVKGQYSCGLIPFAGPTHVATSNLKWNLDNHILQVGGLISTSNTFTDKEINVSCDRDLIWTTQYCKFDE